MTLKEWYKEALIFARDAVEEDRKGHAATAKAIYVEAIEILVKIAKVETDENKKKDATNKAQAYLQRAEALAEKMSQVKEAQAEENPPTSPFEQRYDQAQFSFQEALANDENGHHAMAADGYVDAASLYLKALQVLPENDKRHNEIRDITSKLISRAEELKGIQSSMATLDIQAAPPETRARPRSSGNGGLSDREISVLTHTSKINGNLYLPWVDRDLGERFSYPEAFCDPDGFLHLSQKQKTVFGGWKRLCQLVRHPKMIYLISSTSIVQETVTDCSFVASLCITAAYERKFKKRLITRCIYPQNKLGEPMYNPSGKYVIKLHYNGVPRKVIIDDYLPVHKSKSSLLCTYSMHRHEFWPCIIEKAYMKLCGGYDFPGSNSGIDLYCLTGWIPDHLFIQSSDFNKENTWNRMIDGHKYGDALITVSTNVMEEAEADRLGLVPTHAYAVLDVKQVHGCRLLQLKNPWCHKRWTGNFSHHDTTHWTPQLKQALHYDQLSAMENDNGIFWIDYDSVLQYFGSIHMNWNPELFSYRSVQHLAWPSYQGPQKDAYNMGKNPQFALTTTIQDPTKNSIWILLTRHITKTEENTDYIAMHVYNSNANRIYYPHDALIRGVYVNTPHILTRFNAPPGETSKYTLVVSQKEKKAGQCFTIRIFSMSTFNFGMIPDVYTEEKKIVGQWTKETAGGTPAHPGYLENPQYQFIIPATVAKSKPSLLLTLEVPRTLAGNMEVFRSDEATSMEKAESQDKHRTILPRQRLRQYRRESLVASSGDYRPGFCYVELQQPSPGVYTVIPSTFEPNQLASFFITLHQPSALPPARLLDLTHLAHDAVAYPHTRCLTGAWTGVTAAGCARFGRYDDNPRFTLHATAPCCTATFRLHVQREAAGPGAAPPPALHMALRVPGDGGRVVYATGPYRATPHGLYTPPLQLPSGGGHVDVIVSTYTPDERAFQLDIHATTPVRLVGTGGRDA